jgi:hypothetical protein
VKIPTLKVFVMPWLSPAASVGTHDFETMLAVFQLNAGLGGARAFSTPAIQQSDMKGLGSTFSHHQKCVVIDPTIYSKPGGDKPASIWPTWTYRLPGDHKLGGKLVDCLPHEEAFWDSKTWVGVRTYKAPEGIQGFITALPTHWTKGENNDSGLNLTIIAHNEKNKNAVHLADVNEASSGTEHSS